ncbi:MAG: hypothetical protein ACOCUL_04685 [Bacteroidota bacterium]
MYEIKTKYEQLITDENDVKLEKFAEDIKAGRKKIIAVENDRLPRNLNYFRGWQMGFEKLAINKKLTVIDYRLLMLLFSRLDYENFIQLTQVDMATLLSIHRTQATRSIKKLINYGIIEKATKGRNNYYRLNHEIAWRGSNKEFKNVTDIKDFIKKNNIHKASRNNLIAKKLSPF